MKTTIKSFLAVALFFCISLNSFGQCGTETVSILGNGYCNNQNAEIQILDNNTAAGYKWFNILNNFTSNFTYTRNFTSQNTILTTSGPAFFQYQKEVATIGGPSSTLIANPNSGTPVNVSSNITNVPEFSIPFSSSVAFKLNYIEVGMFLYGNPPNSTHRIKVQSIGTGNTVTSDWITYNPTSVTMTPSSYSSNGVYTFRIPVNSGGNLGLTIPAGSNQRLRIYETDASDASQPTANTFGNFAWQLASSFSNNYTIGGFINTSYAGTPTTVSGNPRVPSIYDWDVTVLCPLSTVTVNPTSIGCCQPITTQPTIVSTTNSNTVDVPIPQPYILTATGLNPSFYYQWYKNFVALSGTSAAGIGVTSLAVTSPGKYTVRVVTSAGFINRLSCYKDQTYWVQERIISASALPSIICLGSRSTLLAVGATGTLNWASSNGLSNRTITNPVFTVTAPGIYTYTVTGQVPVGNQIVNGDFETGDNTGVNHGAGYTYVPFAPTGTTTSATNPDGIGTYPAPVDPRLNFNVGGNGRYSIFTKYIPHPYPAVQPCVDHTTGSGSMLYTDAASGGSLTGQNNYLWSQDVVVEPNTTYEFSAWVTNASSEADPFITVNTGRAPIKPTPDKNGIIQLYANDVPLLPSAYTISGRVCNWEKVSATYNSGSTSGTIRLKFASILWENFGNDFAVDDIAFGTPGSQSDITTVTVTDCNFITVSSTTTCSGKVATLSASTNGIFANWTTTAGGVTGITSPNSPTTTVSTTSTNFVFNATAKFLFGNMLTNGNFSSGNSGFTSSYNNVPSGSVYGGQYAITSTPSNRDASPFVFLDKLDRTGDATRNMMLINANKGNGAIIYSTTISGIQSGTEYGFSMWLANVNQVFTNATPDTSNTYPNPKTANVEIFVNGTSLGRIKQPLDTVWRQYGGLWTAPSSANAVIQIVNRETLGSDISGFVIDDLKFSTTYSITKTATVTSPICALPVNYLSFEAINKPKSVELQWKTISETNNSHFEIERSSDGENFKKLGSVVSSHASIAQVQDYSFSDYNPLIGNNYYRIKQVDFDGKFSYTPIRMVQRESSFIVKLYPNPSENSFNISILQGNTNKVTATLKDISGRQITKFDFNADEIVSFGNELAAGIYLLELSSGDNFEIQKLIKN